MAAYDISDVVLTSGCQSSPLILHTVWKYVPENISFGRILHVFHESAIVTLYEGKVRFVYPEIDSPAGDAKTIATYQVCNCLLFTLEGLTDTAVHSSRPRHHIVPSIQQFSPRNEYSGLCAFPAHCLPRRVQSTLSKQQCFLPQVTKSAKSTGYSLIMTSSLPTKVV